MPVSGYVTVGKSMPVLQSDQLAEESAGICGLSRNARKSEEARWRAIIICDRMLEGEDKIKGRPATEILYEALRAVCHCGGGFRLHIENATSPFMPTDQDSQELLQVVKSVLCNELERHGKSMKRQLLLAHSLELHSRQAAGRLRL